MIAAFAHRESWGIWYTAGGVQFSLDSPVEGAADYYAGYATVAVDTKDETDIGAVVTVSSNALDSIAGPEGVDGVTFTLAPRDSADSPLRYATAKSSYTILKSYDMRLVAKTKEGDESQISGDFGTAQLKVYVGTKYRNASVRAFWLGMKNGSEAAMNSAVKEVDANGYITISIGNFIVGDESEGGNLAIAYIEGGASSGTLPSDEVQNESSSSLTVNNPAGTALNSSSLSGSLGSSTLGGNALGSGSLNGSLQPSTSLNSSLSSGSSGLGLPSTGSSGSALPSSSGSALSPSNDSGLTTDGKADANGGGLEGEDIDGGAGESEGWGSEAWVLLLLAAGLLAALLRKLWLVFVVRQRREEQEAEMPAMEEQYAKGIHF